MTNLLTRLDSSHAIGDEVKDGSTRCRDQRILRLLPLYGALVSSGRFWPSAGLPFLSVIVLMKILSGQGIVEVLTNYPFIFWLNAGSSD